MLVRLRRMKEADDFFNYNWSFLFILAGKIVSIAKAASQHHLPGRGISICYWSN